MATKINPHHLMLVLLLGASSQIGAQDAPRQPYTPAQYLKNYALSSCLSNGLHETEARQEAIDAAKGYLELGSFGIEAYQEAATLGRTFLAKKYMGINGEKLTVMKCIDLFHSKELDLLVKKYGRKSR